jgi:hypothetical protein
MAALLLTLAALAAAGWAFVTGLMTVRRHDAIWPHFGIRDTRCARLDSVVYAVLAFSTGAAFVHIVIYGLEFIQLMLTKPAGLLGADTMTVARRGLTAGSVLLWGFVHLLIDRLLHLDAVRAALTTCNLWRRP